MREVRNDKNLTHGQKKLEVDRISREIADAMAVLIKEQREQRRAARNQQ
jgi:hypothetical protein